MTTIRKKASDDLAPVFSPKLEKSDARVNYRAASSPGEQCGTCRFFVGAGACRLVEGTIRSDFVSDLYTSVEARVNDAAPVPFREGAIETTWAYCRLENEAAKFRVVEPTLTREQAVVKASERFPKLVQLHRGLLRNGVVEPRDDAPSNDAPPEEVPALTELRVKAREIRAAEPELSEAQSMVRASSRFPNIVTAYRLEMGFRQ